jgi:hypothetical protein
MKSSVLHYITTCPKCHVSYVPDLGEICKCPEQGESEYEDAHQSTSGPEVETDTP